MHGGDPIEAATSRQDPFTETSGGPGSWVLGQLYRLWLQLEQAREHWRAYWK